MISLPLVGSVLLPRRGCVATCGALVFVAFATAIEVSLFDLFGAGPKGRPEEYVVFVAINVFQSVWVLTVISLLRIGGFKLSSSGPRPASG